MQRDHADGHREHHLDVVPDERQPTRQVRAARLVIRGGSHFSSKTVIGCRGLSNWLVMPSRLPAEPRPAEDGQPEFQVRPATESGVRVAGTDCYLAEGIPF